jgi:hypothetical protein
MLTTAVPQLSLCV